MFECVGGVGDPIESQAGFGKQDDQAAGVVHEFARRADEVSYDGSDSMLARRVGQKLELNRTQQQLRDLARNIESSIGVESQAWRMVQVEVYQGAFEGVFLASFSPVSPDQFLNFKGPSC